jgi:hypothetical protein
MASSAVSGVAVSRMNRATPDDMARPRRQRDECLVVVVVDVGEVGEHLRVQARRARVESAVAGLLAELLDRGGQRWCVVAAHRPDQYRVSRPEPETSFLHHRSCLLWTRSACNS